MWQSIGWAIPIAGILLFVGPMFFCLSDEELDYSQFELAELKAASPPVNKNEIQVAEIPKDNYTLPKDSEKKDSEKNKEEKSPDLGEA